MGLSLLDEHDQTNHLRNIADDEKTVVRKSEPGYVQLESSEARKVARDDGWQFDWVVKCTGNTE